MRCRDIPHQTPIFSEWRGSSCTAFGFSLAQISHTMNVLLFKFRCNIFIGVRIIKEMPGSVPSGTHCIIPCSAEVKNEWDSTSIPPYALMPQCLIIPGLYPFLTYKSTQPGFANFARYSLSDELYSCLQNPVLHSPRFKPRSEGTPSVHEPSLKLPIVRHCLHCASLF